VRRDPEEKDDYYKQRARPRNPRTASSDTPEYAFGSGDCRPAEPGASVARHSRIGGVKTLQSERPVEFETLLVERSSGALTLTLHRPEARNSLDAALLDELHRALDLAERDPACALVIVQGEGGVFCTGMDFEEFAATVRAEDPARLRRWAASYTRALSRLSRLARVVVANVDGEVLAGGVGIAAACDLVVATTRSRFSLPEALWGLLPANVAPYLIRRVGFQRAYAMALTTGVVTASDARAAGLVDELTDRPDDALRALHRRVSRLDPRTILDLKRYFRAMWIVTDATEEAAADELVRLAADPRVQRNVTDFLNHQRLPWEPPDEP
jgi:polyketide biosynthesis enoyl-CoA hydratase PksH